MKENADVPADRQGRDKRPYREPAMKENADIPADWPEKTTFGAWFRAVAAGAGDRAVLVYRDPARTVTYRELDLLSDAIAKSIIAMGIEKGTHAALWAPNIQEWPAILLGCAKAGLPLLLVNTSFRSYDLEYCLNLVDVGILFLASGNGQPGEYISALYEACPGLGDSQPGKISSQKLPHLRTAVQIDDGNHRGILPWTAFLGQGEQVARTDLQARESSVRPEDRFIFLFTSGTTGWPKCITWTHERLIGTTFTLADGFGLAPGDVVCIPPPFFHLLGCGILLSALSSSCTVAPLERFNPQEMLRTIETFRVTHIFGVPSMFVSALNEYNRTRYNTASLRGGVVAGAVSPPAVVRAVMDILGAREFGICYGLSEVLATITRPSDPMECRTGSIGRPLRDTDIRIVHPLDGTDVRPGETGEILVRSPWMISGYYDKPDTIVAATDDDGFLHTGDLGFVDGDGYYHIAGRSRDLIIRGGENISPSEIEEFLLTHPAVMDAQVVGIKSEYYGEEPVAFVRTKPGQAVTALGLKQFCRRSIAIEKVPSTFFFVDQYPLTASGKVQKFRLREMAAELLSEQKR